MGQKPKLAKIKIHKKEMEKAGALCVGYDSGGRRKYNYTTMPDPDC